MIINIPDFIIIWLKPALVINPTSTSSTTDTPKIMCKLNYRREQDTFNTFIDVSRKKTKNENCPKHFS